MSKEILSWIVKVRRRDLLNKKNVLFPISLAFYSFIILIILSFYYPSIFIVMIIFLFLFMDFAFLLWISYSKTRIIYIITNNGLAKATANKKNEVSLSGKMAVEMDKFRSEVLLNKIGTPFYMPFEAIAGYTNQGNKIIVTPKLPGLDFVIITDEANKEEILKTLKKHVKNA